MKSGLRAYQGGALDQAAVDWLEAASRYRDESRPQLRAQALSRAAQARGALGFVSEQQKLLEEALAVLPPDADPGDTSAILAALARSHAELGEDGKAEAVIEDARARAHTAGAPGLEAAILQGRGELREAQGDAAGAAADFARSEDLAMAAGNLLLAGQGAARRARATLENGESKGVGEDLARALERAQALPATDAVAQLKIHVGRSYEQLAALDSGRSSAWLGSAAQVYSGAIEAAGDSGAGRSASFALGYLGQIYERAGRTEDGLALTRRAIASAQSTEAPEALYRWHWQLGRLLHSQGQDAAAVAAYRRAVATLQEIRSGTGGAGLSFEESVEPVYFGLVDLLLQRVSSSPDPTRQAQLLAEVRDQLEDLKAAEVREYFRDACLAPERKMEAGAIPGAVIVYPVVLPDRTELIVQGGSGLTRVVVRVSAEELNREIRSFRKLLQRRSTREYRRHAAVLYDWLIRPIEGLIGVEAVDALVFVPGGALRTIPMAALYDRDAKQFLIEKYPVAVIPALTLTDPRGIDRSKVRALVLGLTVPVQGYPALAAAETEMQIVQDSFGGRSLVDAEFVLSSVEKAMADEPFGILHIATHGEFRSRSSESFLITFDGRLEVDALAILVERSRFPDQPIELLTLSACETAIGDDRAALGLAGVAIRAGARSAVATLWTVNDQAAGSLIGEFYQQLAKPGISKAQALQRAQLSLLETRPYRHPGYWAPFLLISNWM